MRFLLDTHLFLWCIKDDKRLSKPARFKIMHATEVYVSSASIWEACIKIKLKKLEVDISEMIAAIKESGFSELPITTHHAASVSKLPDIHRDPFDRMLIAQAISEPLVLLTADRQLEKYSELVSVV
jgi:PIN domain nuclease of toxin-antitoxin system